MPKKKTTAPSRAQKRLEFPSQVLEAKELLRKEGDGYFSIMKKLTEAKDLPQENALKNMWISLEKAANGKKAASENLSNGLWVRFFVGSASIYSTLPPYAYKTKSYRKKLIENLKKHTDQLIKELQRNQLDYRLAHSDRLKILSFYEWLDFLDNWNADKSDKEKPRISEMLNRLIQSVEKDINSAKNSRKDKDTKARQFVRHMSRHLKATYGAPMHSALITATFALHNKMYDIDDIRKILKR